MKKYDFVFLYHPHFYDVDPGAQIGLGLLSLATYAQKLGASVKVINCQSAKTMGAVYRALYPCKYLMMYGCLVDAPILNPIAANAKMHKLCDYVYIGGPIAKSPDRIDSNFVDKLIDCPGEDLIEFFVCNGNKIIGKHLKKNINEYPFPDRTLLEGDYGGNIFKRTEANCEVSTTILTSRGCHYRCAFCVSGKEDFYQDYEMGRIEKEIEHCLSLGIKNFRISDDNLLQTNRIFSLCNLFKEAKIKWRASVRASYHTTDIYRKMVESGCEELSFGIESGDQHVLNILNKGTTVGVNTAAVKRAKLAGVPLVRALLMMGTPGERNGTRNGTYPDNTMTLNTDWVANAKPDMVSLKMFVPYPGTKIHDDPKKYGCTLQVSDLNNSAYRPSGPEAEANIYTDGMTREDLTKQFHIMKKWLEHVKCENRG